MKSTLVASLAALLVCAAGAVPLRAQSTDVCADPANAIVAENCLAGDSQWSELPSDLSVNTFVFPPSVNQGDAVSLSFDTGGAPADVTIFRLGYYGGAGARRVATLPFDQTVDQPACQQQLFSTGLVSCLNWTPVAVPTDETWTSGVYLANVTRRDTGAGNTTIFVVRDDDRDAPLLFQQSNFTFQAYNNFGGKSVYNYNSGWDAGYCNTESGHPRAVSVSLGRPYTPGEMNNPIDTEYALLRWMEEQGYDLSYATNWDTHRWGQADGVNELLDHDVYLSAGHDEYWTQEMRDAVTQARDAGVHFAFFSGNTMYWRMRLEDDPWTGTPVSVMTVYKTSEDGVPDPSGIATTTFRSLDIDDPENAVLGSMYTGDNDDFYFPLRVSAEFAGDPIYRHTDLQTLEPGTFVDIGDDIVGWEWGTIVDNGRQPEDLDVLAETPVMGFLLLDEGNSENGTSSLSNAHMTRYVAENGAQVFSTGTILWGRGLGAHGAEIVPADPYVEQITVNVLADMGLSPATLRDGLIQDGEPGLVSSDAHPVRRVGELSPPQVIDFQADTAAGLLASGRTATFRWSSDRPTLGQIWVGPATGNTFVSAATSDEAFATEHEAVYEALLPGMTYFVRVGSVDEQGTLGMSEEFTFTTPPNLIHTVGSPLLRGWRSVECFSVDYPWVAPLAGVTLVLIVVSGTGWLIIRRQRKAHAGSNAG